MRPSSFLNVHNANTTYLIYMLPQLCAEDYTYYLCIGCQRQKTKTKTIQTEARSNDIIL